LQLIKLANGELDPDGWPGFQRYVLVVLAKQTDDLINRLAGDLGLKVGAAAPVAPIDRR
jgi:hypothetical protein